MHSRFIATVAGLILALGASASAEPVYPRGSRVGLEPPPGMTASAAFMGFEDRERKAAIVTVALPAVAYAEFERSATPDAIKSQGLTEESREHLTVAAGPAFLIVGRQEIDGVNVRKWLLVVGTPDVTALVTVLVPDEARAAYPDAALRASLASLTVRATVPIDEQLSLLPFKVTDMAGFRVGGVYPGRALMLTDADKDAGTPPMASPHIVIAIGSGGPSMASERDKFARDLFAGIPNVKEVRLQAAEPLRLHGQQGHQIFATAKDSAGAEIKIAQWLRFGGSGYLHLIAIAPADAWDGAFPRFRTVRDAVEPR